jgi:hypothetical protein
MMVMAQPALTWESPRYVNPPCGMLAVGYSTASANMGVSQVQVQGRVTTSRIEDACRTGLLCTFRFKGTALRDLYFRFFFLMNYLSPDP